MDCRFQYSTYYTHTNILCYVADKEGIIDDRLHNKLRGGTVKRRGGKSGNEDFTSTQHESTKKKKTKGGEEEFTQVNTCRWDLQPWDLKTFPWLSVCDAQRCWQTRHHVNHAAIEELF